MYKLKSLTAGIEKVVNHNYPSYENTPEHVYKLLYFKEGSSELTTWVHLSVVDSAYTHYRNCFNNPKSGVQDRYNAIAETVLFILHY